MRATAVPWLLLVAACSRGSDALPAPGALPAVGAKAFAREAFAPPPGDAGAAEPPVPTAVDPAALDEILGAAPKPGAAPNPGAADRSTAIGTDTGVAVDGGAAAEHAPERAKSSKVSVGKVTIEADMSNPAIERAARAQLYWPLVQRCRDRGGAILPPEVVHLRFQLDHDGYVLPPTILVTAKEERFAEAARCMQRELSMATFRAPASARGRHHTVATDVPSVD